VSRAGKNVKMLDELPINLVALLIWGKVLPLVLLAEMSRQ
jgi:hypothetical protein